MTTRRWAPLVVLAVAALVTAGCSGKVTGTAVSVYDDPFQVAGLATTDGPSGPRDGVADADLTVDNTDDGDVDTLAKNALDDIQTYWKAEYPKHFDGQFEPVDAIYSWDATAERSALEFCESDTVGFVNAAYCSLDNTIGWDRGVLLPAMIDAFGKMAVVMVLAHEYGHAVQHASKIVDDDTPGLVLEQQADCFAGAFIRSVAEGQSKHFTINTSDGLNSVLAAIIALRDDDPNDRRSIHGSAFERVTAVQIGFTDGPGSCARIDDKEIESRRAGLPVKFESNQDTGDLPITEETLQTLADAMEQILPAKDKPKLDLSGTGSCSDAPTTEPVSYCPSTNTIGTDVSGLADKGAPMRASRDEIPMSVTGDYTAYVVFESRYTLAVQKGKNQELKGAKAALRAACLSGVITAVLGSEDQNPARESFALSPGDLDEAVSGLLTDGLAASDVEGNTVPSGFSRIDAFRGGVLGGQQVCESRYS